MNFKQLLLRYVIGNLSTDELPGMAYKAMEEGFDSPSLVILAGLGKDESFYIVDKYLQSALQELKIILPDKRQAALQYASLITNEIIEGKKDIITGVGEIKEKAIDSYNFHAENTKYVYDSIFFEEVYGLYDTYEDLLDAHIPWVKGKSNEELMVEVKDELLNALKTWSEKIKPYLNE